MNREAGPRNANRLNHGAKLWCEYVDSKLPRQLDKWLADKLRTEKKFGSQDRRFYSDLLFSAARTATTTLFCDFLAREFKISELNSFLLQSCDAQRKQTEVFSQAVKSEAELWEAIKKLKAEVVVQDAFQASHPELEKVSDADKWRQRLIKDLRENDSEDQIPHEADLSLLLVAHGIPAAWTSLLNERIRRSGWLLDDLVRFVSLQNVRAPLWIRLNNTEKRHEVEKDLTSHDLAVTWMEGGEAALVRGSFGVYQCDSFKSGFFEVQDGASQQIASSVHAKPGEKIWDACAGGGGKSVALAAGLRGKGALYASDIREHKLEEAKRRCQRAGFHNVRTLVWNGVDSPKFGKEIYLQAGFDAVLVDAPCSSSGTWRRNPDARLRIADSDSRKSLLDLQLKLLLNAAALVRPGGRLVYGTCSWCVDENEKIAENFLSERANVFNAQTASSLSELFGAPKQDSDTMYSARFERRQS